MAADGSVWVPSTLFIELMNERWRPPSRFTTQALKVLLGKPRKNQKNGKGLHFEKERREWGALKQAPGYRIPPLPEARAAWDACRSPDPTWDEDDDLWAVVGDRYGGSEGDRDVLG